MTALHIRAAALLAASATAVVLSSCSAATKTATEEHGSHSSSASQSDAHNEDAHNEDDVLFAQLMIPHHEQAVTLAAMVPDRSANPEVRALAGEDRERAATRDHHDEGPTEAVGDQSGRDAA